MFPRPRLWFLTLVYTFTSILRLMQHNVQIHRPAVGVNVQILLLTEELGILLSDLSLLTMPLPTISYSLCFLTSGSCLHARQSVGGLTIVRVICLTLYYWMMRGNSPLLAQFPYFINLAESPGTMLITLEDFPTTLIKFGHLTVL